MTPYEDDDEPRCQHCDGPLKDDWHGFPACFCMWDGRCPTGDEVCDMAEIEELLAAITNLTDKK